MKKFALAVAVSGALGASASVNAATVTEFDHGVLVPHVLFEPGVTDTAIGLTSCAAGTVYWAFFDVNSKHVQDDNFDMTRYDQHSFSWEAEAGLGLEGELGYLVFLLDSNRDEILSSSDSPCLAGAAFQLYPANDEVAFLPVPPLAAEDLDLPISEVRLIAGDPLLDLTAGAQEGDDLYLRYWIDNADGGKDTAIVIWSAPEVNGSYVVLMYDDAQNARSVTINLPNRELNILDPETIVGRNIDHTDGFIRWTAPIDGVLSFSVIFDDTRATQTIVNPIERR